MVRLLGIATIVLCSSFFVSCSSETELKPDLPSNQSAVNSKKPLSSETFKVPEANKFITVDVAKKYVSASEGLLLLGEQWSEKIEKAADSEKLEILASYAKAQEQVCLKIGLAGMAEYNWLDTVATKNKLNAKVFEEAGVKLP